jgi:hypothetical protein
MTAQSPHARIADVGETLVDLLHEEIKQRIEFKKSEVALVSPADAASSVRLTLWLYHVTENSQLRDVDRPNLTAAVEERSPLVLDLHYLLTVHPTGRGQGSQGGVSTATTSEQHELLGLAMQVLHDNSILHGEALPASLADSELRITIEQQSMDELTNLWSTFRDHALQPSVAYRVTPVVIDSTVERPKRRVEELTIEEHTPS